MDFNLTEEHLMIKQAARDFAQKEWKERMKHTTVVFHQFMPQNLSEAVSLIDKIIENRAELFFGFHLIQPLAVRLAVRRFQ